MADEHELFLDAGRKLFGEGFMITKKAKERDDELKSLAAQQVGDRRKAPTSRPFFPRQSSHNGEQRQGFKANRERPPFGPYHHTPVSKKDDSRK